MTRPSRFVLFASSLLMAGALPLDVLEAKIDRWIASQR